MRPTRRGFLRTSTLASAAVSTLVEDDPVKLDLPFWLDYFRRTHSDAVCLSAGGCVAFYPTAIPFHHRSAWLGERDVLGDLIAGCRRLGDRAKERIEDPGLGCYQALIEARIPFEMVHDGLLDPEHLAPFQTLILPNVAALSLAQCAQLGIAHRPPREPHEPHAVDLA